MSIVITGTQTPDGTLRLQIGYSTGNYNITGMKGQKVGTPAIAFQKNELVEIALRLGAPKSGIPSTGKSYSQNELITSFRKQGLIKATMKASEYTNDDLLLINWLANKSEEEIVEVLRSRLDERGDLTHLSKDIVQIPLYEPESCSDGCG